MPIRVLFNGTDRTSNIKNKSLRVNMGTDLRKNASVNLITTLEDGMPTEGSILSIYEDEMLIFEGIITEKRVALIDNLSKLDMTISSDGFRTVPYRRTVSDTFEVADNELYFTAKSIIEYMVTNYLSQEGISFDINSINGYHFEDTVEYETKSIGDILDELASTSNCFWYIDVNKILHFAEEYYTFDSEIELDINEGISVDFRNPELSTSLANYANKVFFKGGIEDIETGEDIISIKQDDAEIAVMQSYGGGSGVYGAVVENPLIDTQAKADIYCQKVLDKRKAKEKVLTFDTFDWLYFQVGEKVNINIPPIAIIDNKYVVEQITLTDFGGGKLNKRVEMRQMFPNGQGGYIWSKNNNAQQFFGALANAQKNMQTAIHENNKKIEAYVSPIVAMQNTATGLVATTRNDLATTWTFTKDLEGKITNISNDKGRNIVVTNT